MSEKLVEYLANDVVSRLKEAREILLREMQELGMTPALGWRIVEELRHTVDGTEWTFKPVHLREDPRVDLRRSVVIDHDGRPVTQPT